MSIFSGYIEENLHNKDMQFDKFRRETQAEIFDFQYFAQFFKDLKKTRDKMSSLIIEGKIVRLKRGLYVFGQDYRKTPLSLEVIANILYGPSCISFEYALTRYGLLAERSEMITSLTIGDSKTFETPVGVFEYRAIDPEKFKIGIEYRDLKKEGGYFIASKEKAIVDLVYRTPRIRSLEQLRYYLFEEMRIDVSEFSKLNKIAFQELANIYKKNNLKFLSQL